MGRLIVLLLHALAGAVAALVPVPPAFGGAMSFLDDGAVRVGVDLGKGGTITYLSKSGSTLNVVNSWDLGREVQQSYYAGPDNFGSPAPPWENFPWNPVGAGDTYGHSSTVLEHSNDGRVLYVRSRPLQWALSNVPCECVFEQWISLQAGAAVVRNRMTNNRSDHTPYAAYPQELPAAYAAGAFWRLMTYSGSEPFTGGALSQLAAAPPPDWSPPFQATEHWAALVDDTGFGLGVVNWSTSQFVGGFAGTPGIGGPSDFSTGYIAPVLLDVLDWNIQYEFDYALVVGTVDEIRNWVSAHRPDARPDFHFASDRQRFQVENARDGGWPIGGALHLELEGEDPYLIGPSRVWNASEAPILYLTAAFQGTNGRAELFWSIPGQSFAADRSVQFDVVPDGRTRTYEINLASKPNYRGTISGVRLDPGDGGGMADIYSLTWRAPFQTAVGTAYGTVVEYVHAGFGHYFVTSFSNEILALDGGAFAGAFARTGSRFPVWSAPHPALSPVCRFFSTGFTPKSSHFYTASPSECNLVLRSPDWEYEGTAFYVALPIGGECPSGTHPVYRLYNDGRSGAPNHRFTADKFIRDVSMRELGWIYEGVVFCTP